MSKRIWNFNPGPSTLPLPVLEKMKEEIPNYNNTGMAVMELSHRSKDFIAIHEETKSLLAELYGVPENYKILLLQGGASTQFAMIPMNLLSSNKSADYIKARFDALLESPKVIGDGSQEMKVDEDEEDEDDKTKSKQMKDSETAWQQPLN